MSTLNQMIEIVRNRLNEPLANGYLVDTEIADWLNEAQDHYVNMIVEADMAFFEEINQTIVWVVGQEEYDLPFEVRNRKISSVLRTDLAAEIPLDNIRHNEAKQIAGVLPNVFARGGIYYLLGNKIGFKPTPQEAPPTSNIKITFVRKVAHMLWAAVGSADNSGPSGAGRFVVPNSGADLKAGRASTEADYYNHERIRLLTGPEVGFEATVTAYDPKTRIVTLDVPWPATPSTINTNEFVFLSPIPEEYHPLLLWGASQSIPTKSRDSEMFALARAKAEKLEKQLTNSIEPRNLDHSRHVRTAEDDYLD